MNSLRFNGSKRLQSLGVVKRYFSKDSGPFPLIENRVGLDHIRDPEISKPNQSFSRWNLNDSGSLAYDSGGSRNPLAEQASGDAKVHR